MKPDRILKVLRKLINFHEDAASRTAFMEEAGSVGLPHTLNDRRGTGLSSAALSIIINEVGRTYIPFYSMMGRWGRDIIFFVFMCAFIKTVVDVTVRFAILAHRQYNMRVHSGRRWILGAALWSTLFVTTMVKQESRKTKNQLDGVTYHKANDYEQTEVAEAQLIISLDEASHVEDNNQIESEPVYSTVVKGHKRVLSIGGRSTSEEHPHDDS